jgi:hypothetical protein
MKAFLCNVDRSILVRCDETCAAALKQKKEKAQHQKSDDAHLVEKAATNTSVVREPMCRRDHDTRLICEQGENSITYKFMVDEAPIAILQKGPNSDFSVIIT